MASEIPWFDPSHWTLSTYLEPLCISTVYLQPSTPAKVSIFLLPPSALSMSATVFVTIRLQRLFGYEVMTSESLGSLTLIGHYTNFE
jgi:hypothetical protein